MLYLSREGDQSGIKNNILKRQGNILFLALIILYARILAIE